MVIPLEAKKTLLLKRWKMKGLTKMKQRARNVLKTQWQALDNCGARAAMSEMTRERQGGWVCKRENWTISSTNNSRRGCNESTTRSYSKSLSITSWRMKPVVIRETNREAHRAIETGEVSEAVKTCS